MSREVIKMFDEHFSWVNIWCHNTYSNSVIKTYQEKLEIALNIRLLNSVISMYYKVPSGHKSIKKACKYSINNSVIRESIKNDFRILSVFLTKNPFFFGKEATLHDLQAFTNLAQLRLLYNEIQYPLPDTMDYYSDFYIVSVISPVEESTLDLCAYLPKSKHKEEKGQAIKICIPHNAEKEYDNRTRTILDNTLYKEDEKQENKEIHDVGNDEK